MELIFSGDKERLDKFLVEKMPDLSRSRIQKIIKDGLALVNNKKPSVHQFLKKGNKVEILDIKDIKDINIQYLISKSTEERVKAEQPRTLIPEIIFEDDNILVINKPPGLLVHPRLPAGQVGAPELKDQEPTVVDWLIKKYPPIKKVGDNPELRPGIVHRLDKEASGLMVIAKTQAAFEHLKKQFHDHQVKKEYLALVYGKLKTDYGKIELPVGRAEKGGRMAARAPGQTGKEALTEFEVLERRKNTTLVRVFPRTGRTHQIRVHFFALGHPLVGDPLYQSKKYKEIPSERLMLHAHQLTFTALEGRGRTYVAPIPKEFE